MTDQPSPDYDERRRMEFLGRRNPDFAQTRDGAEDAETIQTAGHLQPRGEPVQTNATQPIGSPNTRPTPDAMREALDARQRVVIEWGERCFGTDHMRDRIVRAARFFEEAAELVQSVGLSRDHAMRAFDHVYSRPAGTPAQEAGGVANTLMALCGALDLSFDECQTAEIERCLAKDPEHFARRNEAKLREVDNLPAPVPSPVIATEPIQDQRNQDWD